MRFLNIKPTCRLWTETVYHVDQPGTQSERHAICFRVPATWLRDGSASTRGAPSSGAPCHQRKEVRRGRPPHRWNRSAAGRPPHGRGRLRVLRGSSSRPCPSRCQCGQAVPLQFNGILPSPARLCRPVSGPAVPAGRAIPAVPPRRCSKHGAIATRQSGRPSAPGRVEDGQTWGRIWRGSAQRPAGPARVGSTR